MSEFLQPVVEEEGLPYGPELIPKPCLDGSIDFSLEIITLDKDRQSLAISLGCLKL
ncbi:MAG: hypothetical protein HC934_14210 [Acaryochloridaceae cyanobacterium SU_2_1]|nr:hypothetical protein [Acaryochloridaceae cyanobacterium SU_2_1]